MAPEQAVRYPVSNLQRKELGRERAFMGVLGKASVKGGV